MGIFCRRPCCCYGQRTCGQNRLSYAVTSMLNDIAQEESQQHLVGPRATRFEKYFMSAATNVNGDNPPAYAICAIEDGMFNTEHTSRLGEPYMKHEGPFTMMIRLKCSHGVLTVYNHFRYPRLLSEIQED